MLNIKDNRIVDKNYINELSIGDIFIYLNNYYMLTNQMENGRFVALNLLSGIVEVFSSHIEVEIVNATLTIER